MLTKETLIRLCNARVELLAIGQTERSIDEIAKSAAMSRFHFSRQFKAIFGVTPVQVRTERRLEHAKHLLVESDDSITEICMAVGFSSLGSFSHLFSSRFGRSPTQYREEFRGKPNKAFPGCLSLLRAAWERN